MPLDLDGARRAVTALGQSLGLGLVETARGILAVVNANMARALRLVTVQRGVDPSSLALLPFGGAGPLHAAALARELGIRSILIPPGPGVLCALGLLVEDLRTDTVRTWVGTLDTTALGPLAQICASTRCCSRVCGNGLYSPFETICVGTGERNAAVSAGAV